MNTQRPENRLSILHEIKYIYHNFLKHKYFIFALLGYFFLEISIFQFTFRNEAFTNFLTQLVPVEMIVGSLPNSIVQVPKCSILSYNFL